MQSMIAVLRAAHCRSVHHYFAIDALREIRTDKGRRLARLLLSHFGRYLSGAKDPDTIFKDFQNHVVHVQDNFWGGAAVTASKWLDETNRLLRTSQWSEVAYAIGVLSHYFTDPWMPLHTGQTARESAYHRPLEWSVCCAYEEILQRALANPALESFAIPSSSDWIKDSIHAGALLSNKFYDVLLDDYDIKESRMNPPLALGVRSKEILSQIFTWVLTGWGSALDRIALDCQVEIPSFTLVWPTLLASTTLPAARLIKSIGCSEQRREVEAILQEYLTTGNVKRNLSEEQTTVAQVRIRQPQLAPPTQEQVRARSMPIVQHQISQPIVNRSISSKVENVEDPQVGKQVERFSKKPVAIVAEKPVVVARVEKTNLPTSPTESMERQKQGDSRINSASPVVDAPAIGPKTAERLQRLGIHTIRDLLACDSTAIAAGLRTSWVKPDTIDRWKTQARLVCEIPGLSAAGAGLLALAGVTSSNDISNRSAHEIHGMVRSVAKTSEGKRILRTKGPPPIETIIRWQSATTPQVA